MTQPEVQPMPPEPQPLEQPPLEQAVDAKAQMGVRDQLLHTLHNSPKGTDVAQVLYQKLGMPPADVRLHGVQSSVAELKPGDLVGWNGGHRADGSYVGNLAVYAGNGEIIEDFYGRQRRRKLNPDEDTFGMPVYLPGDSG